MKMSCFVEFQKFGVMTCFFFLFKEVSFAHQDCICIIWSKIPWKKNITIYSSL